MHERFSGITGILNRKNEFKCHFYTFQEKDTAREVSRHITNPYHLDPGLREKINFFLFSLFFVVPQKVL